ncbi:MAG: hypothetical protein OEZ02_01075 [Anaerolineae bacterium]|nr:hypothetical protein [Anaerolineae bacterium]
MKIPSPIILASFLPFLFSSCSGSSIELGYQPPIIPVRINVNSNGNVSLSASSLVNTPIGIFDLEASQTIAYLRGNTNSRVLVVRVDDKVTIYELVEGEEFRVEFTGDDTLYKKVNLEYETDGDIVLELESSEFSATRSTSLSSSRSSPRANNFSACAAQCNGSNGTKIFPGETKIIYVEWDYENIPLGSEYVRTWTMNKREWVKYICSWPGPISGTEKMVTLSEPGGLHSGTWEVNISIDGEVILSEQIKLTGNWAFWDYTGVFNSCYGKR